MKQTTFEIAETIRNIIVRRAAEVMVYQNWDLDFAASQIRDIADTVKETDWFRQINPSDFTEKEMIELGFKKWSEESTTYLIPLWLYPFLADEFPSEGIGGNSGMIKKSEMDTDNRFGCLAYGVKPNKKG